MTKILIPTDFSETANHASEYAIHLAKKLEAGVVFLHLLTTPVDWRKLPLERESLYPETRASIGDAKDKLLKLQKRAEDLGVEAHTSLIFNTAVEEIEKYVKKENYFLVVMGTHGTKGVNKMLGTNTIRLTERSEVPVLAVKLGQSPKLPSQWVLYSDYEEESEAGFEKLMDLAHNIDAVVQLLYINTPYHFLETPEIEEKMAVFFERHKEEGVKKIVVNARNEEKGIQNFITDCHCDLLALAVHRRSDLSQIFGRSMSAKVIDKLEIPVLSMSNGH